MGVLSGKQETSINKLFSNPSPFVGITESESTFSGNGNIQPAIIIGQDIGTCVVKDCSFDGFVNQAIKLEKVPFKTTIENSEFITDRTGLRDRVEIVDANNVTIRLNQYTGISPLQFTGNSSTEWLADINGAVIEFNSSNNGENDYGLYTAFCDDVIVSDNSYLTNIYGLSHTFVNNILIGKYNLVENSNRGLEIISASNSIFECNILNENRDGIYVASINPAITLRGNRMEFNDRGLVYQQNTNAPPQINQGNWFFNNVFGAEFVNASQAQAQNMVYLFDQNSTNNLEDPVTFSPINWFQSNRNPSFTCGLALESEHEAINPIELQVQGLIDCLGNEITSGDCYDQLYHAWHLVDENQELLLNDEIAFFYYEYSNASLALFPKWYAMKRAIAISYEDAPSKPDIHDWWNPTQEELPVIFDYYTSMNNYMLAKKDEKVQLINSYNAYLESIHTETPIEDNLKTALMWLLHKWNCQNPVEELPLEAIQAMASLCPDIAGPGVNIARSIIASLRLPHEFNDDLCTTNPEAEVSMMITNQSNGYEFSIFPNPASDHLNLIVSTDKANDIFPVFIYNILGQSVMSLILSGENNIIDISKLDAGVYILKSESFHVKFTKN